MPAQWKAPNGTPDHLFDVIKMFFFLKEFCMFMLKKSRYRFGKAPSLLRHWDKAMKQQEKVQSQEAAKSKWF